MFSLTDIQMLLWCCRYLKINKYLRFWFFSARDPSRRYISMVIYAPAPMHHWSLSRRAGSTIGTTGGARAAQEFVGCAGAVPPPERFDSRTSKHVVEQRQKHCTLRWRLQRDEGPHYNVVPRSNREKRLRLLPANNKTSFFIRPTRG